MANKKDNNNFIPNIAIAPGETIRENMDFLGMNQKELAARLDITTKHLSNILNGNAPITYDTALKLESVIGPSAQFWMNLETNYQLSKARLEEQEKLTNDLDKLKDIPYKELSEFGWVKETSDRRERVFNCRSFFGVADLGSVQPSYSVAFRKQKEIQEISDFGVLAWIRRAETEALNIDVDKFNRRKLKSLIPIFRQMTMKQPDEFFPEMQRLCAEYGVVLLLIPYIPKTYICGATIWRNDKAILALSGMGKRSDGFWFTLFHELAHLINHSSKKSHISYDNEKEEDEADLKARNYLIAEEQYKYFIDNYDCRSKSHIVKYSDEIGIAPFVLLGRLQYDQYIGYQHHRELIPPFEINNIIKRIQ
jgi:HTH-type transcriptional regulator / antitoxin HigA